MNPPLIAVRAIYFAATLQLFGLLNFGLWFGGTRPRRWALASIAVALLAMVGWLVLVARDMSGGPADFDTIATVLRETRFGELWLAAALLLIVAAVTLRWRVAAAIAAGLALAVTADTGHAGAEGGAAHLTADAIHLLAVGAWIGGLAPFAAAMVRPDAAAAASRFATLGTVCVCLILVTGGVNSWFLVGNIHALTGTDYGRVLLLKLALFAIMLAVAAVNRFRLTPHAAFATLRRNALIEMALGLAIVIIVSVLGTMAPGYYVSAG